MTAVRAYDVDLRSLIDVLGTNLYTNPGVYVRELLQNAIDAQSASGNRHDPIEITCNGASFSISDHGVGMDRDQIGDLLGTIGRTSKRDALGFASSDTIGQFGVGMLSGFLVGDRIEVQSRRSGAAAVHWTGTAAGNFEVSDGTRDQRGTSVTLVARPGAQEWLAPDRVRTLAATYVGLHPTPVFVNGERVNPAASPVDAADRNSGELAAARVAYCQDEFGFTPLAMFEVAVAEAGLNGVAYVRPTAGDFVSRAGHRCHVKGLLVGDDSDILPSWAYFVRLVVDADGLTPTASREELVRDDLYGAVRTSLGDQVRDWLVALGDDAAGRRRFLDVHETGIKAIARDQPKLLDFVDRYCVFETNMWPMPPASFRARFGIMRYSPSVDDFRVLADILANRGIGLINAGYVFESTLIRALVSADPARSCEALNQQYLLREIGAHEDAQAGVHTATVDAARRALARFGCAAALATFEPDSIPAVLLTDDSAQLANDRRALIADTDGLPDAWRVALDTIDEPDHGDDRGPTLILNTANSLVARLATLHDDRVRGAVIRTLYGQAVIRTRRPLPPIAAAEVDDALGLLAELATKGGATS